MYKDLAKYVSNCPWCQVAKGHYVGTKTNLGSLIATSPLDLLCIDFTKMDPLTDCKEDVLVLAGAFSKFSQVLVTSNQKALTMAKTRVDKWFYIYSILAHIHRHKD